ncbi:hypothetical protein FHR33_003548 [Nonomuraea dietziae]|uniref:Uncharacterized protein n=1 Tax=Nonomuraea dietziae TaxID=65515 RepID=A0A7W5YB11_9ACTN|nr:hypothetical protein [Nonomuraea dietziae]MBB3727688.1 hypothetical protein [Nonomuraea dietziae]
MPSTVVINTQITASWTELVTAAVRSGYSSSRPHHLSVKPCQETFDLLWVSLKPNAIMTAMGRNSQAMISQT